ncbi:MAG TPA: transglutaminase domain-containing protein [Candidatus Acidoferrum sp.]|jgi:hypothetical protein
MLVVAMAVFIYSCAWEYSVRQYLRGFSDAIVPVTATPEQKIDDILAWMRSGPPRAVASDVAALSARDPETTLNYQQLLAVCGTATNAFLNLSRSVGLKSRRLLLLTPERDTKHVVAEVLVGEDWIVVDPTFRVVLRDGHGNYLTRGELRDPVVFAEATKAIPGYPAEYSYENFAHVRISRLPLRGLHLREAMNWIFPGWEESLDWSLLLERESFFVLMCALLAAFFFLLLRLALAWYADHKLLMYRFRLREHTLRAGAAFFSTPEMK